MKLTLHDGRTVAGPTDGELEQLFMSLSDAGDFIILNDEIRGEVRAAGPHHGTFLVQCDLPRGGRVFAGELRQVCFAEALSIFREFQAGRTDWSSRFNSRDAPLPRGTTLALLLVALTAGALLLWWSTRAV
jgi:hypothetical protein